MSIEDAIDARRRNRLELSPRLQEAHKKAQAILKDPAYVIRESDFANAGVYPASAVKQDLEKVIALQKKWSESNTEQEKVAKAIAEVLEAIILTESEMSEWLGKAHTLKSSLYDDYINHSDLLAEWYSPNEGSRLLSLGIDVTFGTRTAEQKLVAIRDEIQNGHLGSIKYFTDARGDFMGTRRNVPRVIIGVGQKAIEELAVLWNTGAKKELGKHPIQRVLLEEIHAQLRAMQAYAMKNGRPAIGKAYEAPLAVVSKLLAEKRALEYGAFSMDPVFTEIMDRTRKVFAI